jgi:4-hydroxybutyrate CoA-transferase
VDLGLADYIPVLLSRDHEAATERRPGMRPYDIVMTVVSPPDENGMCSLGEKMWNKREIIRDSALAIAEVNPHHIRTYGDNQIHVSDIDVLVEHDTFATATAPLLPPNDESPAIVDFLKEVIRDGDTIQIGTGALTNNLVQLGVFESKNDLGFHSEIMPPGIATLVEAGVFTGRRKTLLPNTAVTTAAFVGPDELQMMHMNPKFEIHPSSFVLDPSNIAQIDNLLAINAALAVDLGGQIAADSIGGRQWSGPGGQPDFAIGAMLAKGGRFVSVLPATAARGTVSRIQPLLDTYVTVPRYLADIVITEFGVAQLAGKTMRQRAGELISIAHPDFRADLRHRALNSFTQSVI